MRFGTCAGSVSLRRSAERARRSVEVFMGWLEGACLLAASWKRGLFTHSCAVGRKIVSLISKKLFALLRKWGRDRRKGDSATTAGAATCLEIEPAAPIFVLPENGVSWGTWERVGCWMARTWPPILRPITLDHLDTRMAGAAGGCDSVAGGNSGQSQSNPIAFSRARMARRSQTCRALAKVAASSN